MSIDVTEGRLACRNDPNNLWTGRGMLDHFIASPDVARDTAFQKTAQRVKGATMASERLGLSG